MAPGGSWRKPSHRFLRSTTLAVPIGVVVVLLVGSWNWIPVSFSDQVTTLGAGCYSNCAVGYAQTSFPVGRNVSVHWVVEGGGTVAFRILPPGPTVPSWLLGNQCGETGASGGCSFISSAGNYTFQANNPNPTTQGPQTVNFTATYLRSIL